MSGPVRKHNGRLTEPRLPPRAIAQQDGVTIGDIGDAHTVQPLIGALQDKDDVVRRHAACVLGNLGDTRAVPFLITALSDKGMEVSWCAAHSLGKLNDKRAVEPLIDALSTNVDHYTRQEAARSLGKLSDVRALHPLLDALTDADKYARREAASALGDLGDERALPALLVVERNDHVTTNQAGRQGIRDKLAGNASEKWPRKRSSASRRTNTRGTESER